jgi:hypothetical protein
MGFHSRVFGSNPRRVRRRLVGIAAAFWVLVVAYGAALHNFLGTPLLAMPALYFGGMIGFYIWHWMAHQKFLYPMYKVRPP